MHTRTRKSLLGCSPVLDTSAPVVPRSTALRYAGPRIMYHQLALSKGAQRLGTTRSFARSRLKYYIITQTLQLLRRISGLGLHSLLFVWFDVVRKHATKSQSTYTAGAWTIKKKSLRTTSLILLLLWLFKTCVYLDNAFWDDTIQHFAVRMLGLDQRKCNDTTVLHLASFARVSA